MSKEVRYILRGWPPIIEDTKLGRTLFFCNDSDKSTIIFNDVFTRLVSHVAGTGIVPIDPNDVERDEIIRELFSSITRPDIVSSLRNTSPKKLLSSLAKSSVFGYISKSGLSVMGDDILQDRHGLADYSVLSNPTILIELAVMDHYCLHSGRLSATTLFLSSNGDGKLRIISLNHQKVFDVKLLGTTGQGLLAKSIALEETVLFKAALKNFGKLKTARAIDAVQERMTRYWNNAYYGNPDAQNSGLDFGRFDERFNDPNLLVAIKERIHKALNQ